MIRINLLPEELQKAASTQKTLFLSLLGGVSASVVFAFVLVILYWSVLAIRDEAENRKIQVDLVKEKAAEVDRINEDIAFYKEREKAIIEIKSQRILWSKKLAQLAELTPSSIWITKVAMRTLDPSEYKWDGKTEQTGGRLTLSCFAEGTDVLTMTKFRSALQSGDRSFYKDLIDVRALPDNFFGDFMELSEPSWSQVQLPGYAQVNNLRFDVEMDLRPLVEKPAVEDAKKAPKGAKPAKPANAKKEK